MTDSREYTALTRDSRRDYIKGLYHEGVSSKQVRIFGAMMMRVENLPVSLVVNDISIQRSGLSSFDVGVEIGKLVSRNVLQTTEIENVFSTTFAPHSVFNYGVNECYLYAITDGENTKIGITKDLSGRIRTLQTGSPKKLHLASAILTKRSRALECERWLHNVYSLGRLEGEWFAFRPEGMAAEFQKAVQASCGNHETEMYRNYYS